MSEPDDDERKARMIERHLRSMKRFEQRRDNLEEKKKRGGRRAGRPTRADADDDCDLEGWHEFADDVTDSTRDPRQRHPHAGQRGNEAGQSARVVEVARTEVKVLTTDGIERTAKLLPRVLAVGGVVVGDDVLVDDAGRITARGERRTVLERRAPGQRHRTRLLAANVDLALITLAPRPRGLSLGFLDRAAAAVRSGGIEPLVVVTKMDLVASSELRNELLSQLEAWNQLGGRSYPVSSTTGEGLGPLRRDIAGRVTVLIGHSGVGKSTLINALDPEAGRATGEVREADGRGRHTTTASRLVPFVDGGALVDTPGIRELVPHLSDTESLMQSIPELAGLAERCRFQNCRHSGEEGCAIAEAAQADPRVADALQRYVRLLESLE